MMNHERRVLRLALLIGVPGVAATLILLFAGAYPPRLQWTVGAAVVIAWLLAAFMLRERVIIPLQTLSNMLGALREGDYSLRARGADRDDALGLALLETNLLGETLRSQRLGAMEATALLQTVMSEIDVAVFAFDAVLRLRLVNRAGARLLGKPEERLLGRTAEQLDLAQCLTGAPAHPMDIMFPGGAGRWEVRRGTFRQHGKPHELLVLADVSRTLREEELLAWRRIVRVLSHEINNSLAPITSIAGTLEQLLDRAPRPADRDEDLRRGLRVISGRSEALVRFMSSYARLARLPAPRRQVMDVEAWVRRVAALETRVPVRVERGPSMTIHADSDQLDQLLINIVRNAADAALEQRERDMADGYAIDGASAVCVTWSRRDDRLVVAVDDTGPGLPPRANLFVPFFTTKATGSGIGLVLCRQIAEAHGGSIVLEDRAQGRGCVARLTLPISA